jgi:hypothetical protein
MMLFEPNTVYPNDSGVGGMGEYIDVEGEIISVGPSLDDAVKVTISSKHGAVSGWAHGPTGSYFSTHPMVGSRATIRVYRSGGGWYPDNRVIGGQPRSSRP